MKIKTWVIEPYQRSDGSWNVQKVERMEEYPVDEERPFYYCNVCGDKRYPDCREGCVHVEGYRLQTGKEPPI